MSSSGEEEQAAASNDGRERQQQQGGTTTTSGNRVLSIQSHVVSGYVGNKAAVFPLQLLGFDVDVVNSVHFSNHTGYSGGVTGDVLNGDQLRSILLGLQKNGLLDNVQYLLSGYIGSESFLRAVIDVLQTLRHRQQGGTTTEGGGGRTTSTRRVVRYVCDPVLGDSGKFYVPESLVEVYRKEVIPLADVVTPNQFEVEHLTGIQVKSMDDALRACKVLHDMGPELVIITSVVIADDDDDGGLEYNSAYSQEEHKNGDKQIISILASKRSDTTTDDDDGNNNTTGGGGGTSRPSDKVWRIDSPYINGVFTGTGDLTAALLLAWTARLPDDIPSCLEKVVGTMHAVIQRTSEMGMGMDDDSNMASRELRLVQSKKDIEDPPPVRFKTRRIV